jgi:hypothetical protein
MRSDSYHQMVAKSKSALPFHGPRWRVTSVLNKPMTIPTNALSDPLPTGDSGLDAGGPSVHYTSKARGLHQAPYGSAGNEQPSCYHTLFAQ